MTHKEKAAWYFEHKFNCSQSVFTAFAEDLGISEKQALMISTNFGGGARKGELCGAVSGAQMALGMMFGHFDSEDAESKKRAYKISEQFMDRFAKKQGSVVCRELLGYDLSKPEGMAVIKEKNLFKTICPELIKCAVETVEEIIEENKI